MCPRGLRFVYQSDALAALDHVLTLSPQMGLQLWLLSQV